MREGIYEGVFAIHKPKDITSAQVIRDAQDQFDASATFEPLIRDQQARIDADSHNQKQKRRKWKVQQAAKVKMGHGGTLDPMATGVLILGVGHGTKSLNQFLECTKSYEAVVLFGAATDSYDAVGKIVATKPYAHVTRQKVETALSRFRGEIMQKPPIFSALRIQGKRLYEYAREGIELPREIAERPVTVEELELVEWMDGGSHEWNWPTTRAGSEERAVAEKLLPASDSSAQETPLAKRQKLDKPGEEDDTPPELAVEPSQTNAQDDSDTTQGTRLCPAPACRIRMTVTSGFYVRSLCHDLGIALDSLALMSSLVRTRQSDFKLGENVLEYADLGKGEDVWGPKVKNMLTDWQDRAVARPEHDAATTKKHGDHSRSTNGRSKSGRAPRERRNSSSEGE